MSESFVHHFIDAHGPDYDHEQLLFTVRDLTVAGTETTAALIRWAIVLLTNHMSIQERLHAEVDSVVGRHRLPTTDDRLRSDHSAATRQLLNTHLSWPIVDIFCQPICLAACCWLRLADGESLNAYIVQGLEWRVRAPP